jgi:hypothetical protein
MALKTIADPDARAEIAERVKSVEPGLTGLWGRMSVHQMLCHCIDSFRVVSGEKAAKPAITPLSRMVIRHLALRLPMEWPKGTPTRPEVEQGKGGTPPGNFATNRKELLAEIDRFCAPGFDFSRCVHPIFGKLSKWEWQRWAYLHVDHHLRQFGR